MFSMVKASPRCARDAVAPLTFAGVAAYSSKGFEAALAATIDGWKREK